MVLGVDFVEAITKQVSACDALVAVIGKYWLSITGPDNLRRLDNPDDPVRIEVQTALEQDVRVIPVLVDGATMPRTEDLPDGLKKLTRRSGIEVIDTHFDMDVERLARTLQEVVAAKRKSAGPERAGSEDLRRAAPETVPKKAEFSPSLARAERQDLLAPLKAKRGWIVALGVVYVIAGLIALSSAVTATIASVYLVGIMMLIAGVFEVISAFQIKSWGRFLFWLALGILYIIAGFVAFDNPLLTAVWLTLILGAALVASGLLRIYIGFSLQGGTPWGWVVASGAITSLLGVVIILHWPVASLWTLGLFLSVDLAITGACWIGLGAGLRRHP
jgi:uncharacterized membrane protein HdeD (DUF308 family)